MRLALAGLGLALATPLLGLDPTVQISQYHLQVWGEEHLPSPIITQLLQTRDGYLWIGTPEGLARFDGARFEAFTPVTTDGVVPSYILALAEDVTGVLWIGTANGLVRFWDGTFTHFSARDGLPQDVVMSLAAAPDGSVWIGTNGGGLCRLRDGRFTTLTTRDGLGSDFPLALQVDREGSLWIGHLRSVDRWRDGRIETVLPVGRLVASPPGSDVRLLTPEGPAVWRNGGIVPDPQAPAGTLRILDDRDGGLWLGVADRGLCRGHGGQIACAGLQWILPQAEGAPPIDVEALVEDRAGNLWIGTDRALVCLSNPRVVPLGPREGFPSETARTVVEDRAGRLWAGGADGLIVPTRTGWRLVTTRDGLPANHVTSLLAARDGTVWVGTEAGVRVWREGRLALPPSPLTAAATLFSTSRRTPPGESG